MAGLLLHCMLITLLGILWKTLIFSEAQTSQPYPAIFIFGDSLVDVGNNNYINTFAKANNPPYGIDFPSGATGRFCNGKTVTDFIGEYISLPFPPPYLAPTTRGKALLQGVNYASAAGGLLQHSGFNFVGRVDMDTQITWFANNIQALQQLQGSSATQTLLARSLFVTVMGSNDYINNYLIKNSRASQQYTPQQYQQLLLDKLSSQLTQLYNLGVRTHLVSNIGPIGCIPSQLARRSVNGECADYPNLLVSNFNEGLNSLLQQLEAQLPGSRLIYIDNYTPVLNYSKDPSSYGFKVGDTACCGAGKFKGIVLCLQFITPCKDRPDYVWWDPYHPTEEVNKLLANNVVKLIPT